MIELKLTLKYDDTALSAKAMGGTPEIIIEQMDDLIKKLANLDLQNFWAKMTEHASEPVLISANNLKSKTIESTHISGVNLEKQKKKIAADPEVKIYNIVDKSGNQLICKYCGGIISWDLRPERNLPLHCNKLGQIVGDGNCHA